MTDCIKSKSTGGSKGLASLMDADKREIRPLFAQTYGAQNERRW